MLMRDFLNIRIFYGALGSTHGLDNPFLYCKNTGMQQTGKAPTASTLTAEMSTDSPELSRTGGPDCHPYDLAHRNDKIFDVPSQIINSQGQPPDNLIYSSWLNA